ncbi:zinc ABC transporter substrate-binding protein [Roseobacter sp. EG26]|uniref:zinc ABC transporter substrate-binding protein n=1 Tax=Roseobacter sp. EG26 TaxID=3412477 RepID=UPI003CE4D27B
MRLLIPLLLTFSILRPAQADVPRVVTDIAPVHGLVERVMAGLGAPEVILPPGASPHSYAMRPSEARALSGADLVFWVGPALTPWLAGPIETLAPDAQHIAFMELESVALLPFREGAMFEAHDDHDHGEHAHDTHDAHDGPVDPHVWLDPHNARVFMAEVARQLGAADPENAEHYAENARAGGAEIEALETRITAELSTVSGRPFLVLHDAYHYFEAHFGFEAMGAISLADGGGASAARLSELHDKVSEMGVSCVLTEPNAQRGLIDAVAAQGDITVQEVDPLGVALPRGPDFYPALLSEIATGLGICLGDKSS